MANNIPRKVRMRHTLIECRAFANRGTEDLLGLRPELPNGISRSRQEKREYGRRGSVTPPYNQTSRAASGAPARQCQDRQIKRRSAWPRGRAVHAASPV